MLGWLVGMLGPDAYRELMDRWRERRRERVQIPRQMALTPASRITDVQEDVPARVVGNVAAHGDLLEAGLTGRPCVYYRVRIERGSDPVEVLVHEIASVAFELEDGTGRAIVIPTGAELAVIADVRARRKAKAMKAISSRHLDALLERHDHPTAPWFKNNLRYSEAVIRPGDLVAVLGSGTREPDRDAQPRPEYRGAPYTRLRLTSSRQFPLLITTSPRATRD